MCGEPLRVGVVHLHLMLSRIVEVWALVPRSRSSAGPVHSTHLDDVSNTIEDEYNGRLRDLMKRLGYDATARRFPVTGPNKPDGAWTFTDPNGSEATAIFSGKMGTA